MCIFSIVEELAEDAKDGGDNDGDVDNLAPAPSPAGCVSVSVCIYYNYTFLPSQSVATCYLPIAGDLEGI